MPSMSAWLTMSLGSMGARPSCAAASKYVVRLMPMKQIFLPDASAAALTLANLFHEESTTAKLGCI